MKTDEKKIEALMQTEPNEVPPPPYNGASSLSSPDSSASSNTAVLQDEVVVIIPQVSSLPQKQTPPHIYDKPPKKRGWFVDTISDCEAWMAVFYFMFVGFPIAIVAFCWCIPTVVAGFVSWIFPPAGAFIWMGFAYTWRILGRLELVSLEMCGKPFRRHDPNRNTWVRPVYPPVFLVKHESNSPGFLTCIWDLSTDPFTISSVLYFIGFNFVFTTLAFCLVVPFFSCAMALMICCMPLCCIVAKEFAIFKINVAHKMLIPQ